MQRRNRMLLCLAAFMACLLPGTAFSADWTTRGGGPGRPQASGESFGVMASVPAWEAVEPGATSGIGPTGSQPIMVGSKIYHLAGSDLWEIDQEGRARAIARNVNTKPNGEVRPSTSGITHAVINGKEYLYYGSGNNALCMLPLPSGRQRCVTLSRLPAPEQRIVTAPLVMLVRDGAAVRHDITIMGDKEGRLWVIQDLATAETPSGVITAHDYVGGWVLASPVQIGAEEDLTFVWGTDRGDEGAIGAYRVVPQGNGQPLHFEAEWPRDVKTLAGIADGFAKDGDYIYGADTKGNMYRINTKRFKVETFPYADLGGPMFANAAPAFDDEHIYFTIRNTGTAQPSTTAPGRLVALDRQSFTLAGGWTADLPAPGNTNPLVWTAGPNVVLVGDTRGVLHAYNRHTGASADFAIAPTGQSAAGEDMCAPLDHLDMGAPGQAGQAYQTLTGISEPIIASGTTGQGLLLVGVSGADDQGELSGTLRAFRAGGAYNIRWTAAAPQPADLAPGQAFEARGELTLTPWGGAPQQPRTVGLEAYWVPADSGGKVRLLEQKAVTVNATGTTPVSLSFTPTEADGGEGTLMLVINPGQLMFARTQAGRDLRRAMSLAEGLPAGFFEQKFAEGDMTPLIQRLAGARLPGNCAASEAELLPTGWDSATVDNVLTLPLTVAQPIDLSVHSLGAPAALACDLSGSFTATFQIRNPSGRTLKDVPFALRAVSNTRGERPVAGGRLDLAPGDTPVSAQVDLAGCGQTLVLVAEVNPGPAPRALQEPDYSNNTAQRSVAVAAYDAQAGAPSITGGRQIIVPSDCQENPDLTSPQPCLNYPHLIMP